MKHREISGAQGLPWEKPKGEGWETARENALGNGLVTYTGNSLGPLGFYIASEKCARRETFLKTTSLYSFFFELHFIYNGRNSSIYIYIYIIKSLSYKMYF